MSRVYIGRLSYRAREKDVERFFKGYGKILEVDLKNGYGFVEFDDPRDADDAVYDLNGKELCGERVIVEHTKGPRGGGGGGGGGGRSGYGRWGRDRYGPPIRTDYRLIVENLSSRCSWQDLKVCHLWTETTLQTINSSFDSMPEKSDRFLGSNTSRSHSICF
uniref:Serine and arginine rich splicing factor 4 n=1 Tax=Cynoglossus semilaevis TaxID=244447 RepID=A0A3P8VR37_CYNSE